MQLAGHSRMIAPALAIAAIAAPAASAQPNRDSQQQQQRLYVNPSTGFATPVAGAQPQTSGPRPEVHPNRHDQTTVTTAVGPPIVRPARASDQAAINRAQAQAADRSAYTPSPAARYSSAGLGVHASGPTGGHPAAVRMITPGTPFDWSDAAIGAGGGLAVSLLVVGGALLIARRRQPKGSPHKALVG